MEAEKLIRQQGFQKLITTGPPHSTHLVGLQLKTQFGIQWWADFRDPWTDIFYNKDLYRTAWANRTDVRWEEKYYKPPMVFLPLWGKSGSQTPNKAPDQSFYVLPNGYDALLMSSIPKTT